MEGEGEGSRGGMVTFGSLISLSGVPGHTH